MGLIHELPRLPLALFALWLLAQAWLLNNPEPAREESPEPAQDCCPFCGVAYDEEGPLCWCGQAESWR